MHANHHDENTNVVILHREVETLDVEAPIRTTGKFILRRPLVFWRLKKEATDEKYILSALRVHPDWSEVFGEWELDSNAHSEGLSAHAFFAGCDFAGFGCNAAVENLVDMFAGVGIDMGYELRRRVDTRVLFFHYYPQLIISCYGDHFSAALRCYCVPFKFMNDEVNAQMKADLEMFKMMIKRHRKLPKSVGGIDQFLFPKSRPNWGM